MYQVCRLEKESKNPPWNLALNPKMEVVKVETARVSGSEYNLATEMCDGETEAERMRPSGVEGERRTGKEGDSGREKQRGEEDPRQRDRVEERVDLMVEEE